MTFRPCSMGVLLGAALAWGAATHAQTSDAASTVEERQQDATPDDGIPGLICIVSGYDLVLRNEGAAPIPAGTLVAWAVPYARKEGQHEMDEDLPTGGQVFLTAVMGATYLDPRKPCTLNFAAAQDGVTAD